MIWMNETGCLRDQVMRGTPPDIQETCMAKLTPPSEIERDLVHDRYWKKIVGPEAPSGSHVCPPQLRNIPPSSTALDSNTEENDQHDITPPEDNEHSEILK